MENENTLTVNSNRYGGEQGSATRRPATAVLGVRAAVIPHPRSHQAVPTWQSSFAAPPGPSGTPLLHVTRAGMGTVLAAVRLTTRSLAILRPCIIPVRFLAPVCSSHSCALARPTRSSCFRFQQPRSPFPSRGSSLRRRAKSTAARRRRVPVHQAISPASPQLPCAPFAQTRSPSPSRTCPRETVFLAAGHRASEAPPPSTSLLR
jgi:hypothetical protein